MAVIGIPSAYALRRLLEDGTQVIDLYKRYMAMLLICIFYTKKMLWKY